MSRGEVVEIRDNALLRAIPMEDLQEAGLDLARTTFAAGEVVFEESSPGDCCYLIESGLIRISKNAAGAGHETLGFIGPGEFFGELALFYAAPRAARATAVSETCTVRLDREDFERLRAIAPLEVTTAIGTAGIRHLRELHGQFIQHVTDSDRFRDIGVGLGRIAHDIRSPLATIKNAAELLAEVISAGQIDPAHLLRLTAMIDRTATGALESADQLLADIRGEGGRTEVAIPADALVREAAEQVRGLTIGRPIELQTVIEYEGTLIGERGELVRALVNVLRNSVESLPHEGGRVVLRVAAEPGAIVFSVSDNGVGIPPQLIGRIFERRFTHGKMGGTGLGLAQTRHVVERHGGRIDVDSVPGSGTTFHMRFPVARGGTESTRREPSARPPSTGVAE
jgi:signal transduction histidine kinase